MLTTSVVEAAQSLKQGNVLAYPTDSMGIRLRSF